MFTVTNVILSIIMFIIVSGIISLSLEFVSVIPLTVRRVLTISLSLFITYLMFERDFFLPEDWDKKLKDKLSFDDEKKKKDEKEKKHEEDKKKNLPVENHYHVFLDNI